MSRGQARTPLLDQALKYAGRGLAVLPVNPDTKAPLNSNGCHGATSDPGTLVRWFQDQFPRAGIGIATGARRGPVVIDVDPRNRGEEGLRQAVDRLGPLPPCPTASSPSGGPHFYLDPGDEPVPCSAGKLGAGVDVRGDGGYVVAPPTSGARGSWRWTTERMPLPELPAAWRRAMTAPAAVPLTRAQRGGAWADLVAAGVGEGERNVTLTRLVGHLLARDVDARLVLELAHTVNASRFRPPLDAREVARTVESVAGRELRKRTRAAA